MGKKPFGGGPPGGGKKGGRGKQSTLSSIALLTALAALVYFASVFVFNSQLDDASSKRTHQQSASSSKPPKPSATTASAKQRRYTSPGAKPPTKGGSKARRLKHESSEWTGLTRDIEACLASQDELMNVPVEWPGFHALCIDAVNAEEIRVLVHPRSGDRHANGDKPRPLSVDGAAAAPVVADEELDGTLITSLVGALQEELLEHEFQQVDSMVSTSAYDHVPNPWRLFTSRGAVIDADADLLSLGRGAAVWLYTGGQFIWPGVRIGHTFSVPIPLASGETKDVMMTTKSLRPTVFTLHGFLSDDECAFIKHYASSRMVPSGLAMMDSSRDAADVRTSTQTFMERNGSPQIRALEERAHNLTRLPYHLGENIQVVRYEKGQKYGAHRDFFNPNDYHKQPSMLHNVEYGARNRMATVFWYLETVADGGETFFPRALNEDGKEYHPWNGNHDDCYRGLYVPPVQGNAVLFYSMVPDGRLDERSLHGGCRPRKDGVEKWGANQWIWNHAQRRTHSAVAPRRAAGGRKSRTASRTRGGPDCVDSDDNCQAWADGGECSKNAEYMLTNCRASCGVCGS